MEVAKKDNSKRAFLIIQLISFSACDAVHAHGMNKFLKRASDFSGSQGFLLVKAVLCLCVLTAEVCVYGHKLECPRMPCLEKTNSRFHVHLATCSDVCEFRRYPMRIA